MEDTSALVLIVLHYSFEALTNMSNEIRASISIAKSKRILTYTKIFCIRFVRILKSCFFCSILKKAHHLIFYTFTYERNQAASYILLYSIAFSREERS